MKEFLSQRFLDNTISLFLEVTIAILLALLIKRILSKFLGEFLLKLLIKADKGHHNEPFIKYVVKPLELFILLIVIIVSVSKLNFPAILKFDVYKISFQTLLEGIANTALVIAFIKLCLGFVTFGAMVFEEKAKQKHKPREGQFVLFFRDFFKVIFYIIGGILILKFTFKYDVSKLLTGLSIVGAAIALGTRESLENLIASFIIFFDKPFTAGDVVKVQSFTGTVERIGLRSTRIRTDQKTFITVPNKQMVDSILDNLSLRSQRSGEIKFEISVDTPTENIMQTLKDIHEIYSQKELISFSVWLSSTGKSGNLISSEYFKGMDVSLEEFNLEHQQLILSILNILKKNNTPIATPIFIKTEG